MSSLPLLDLPADDVPAADTKLRRIARKFRSVMEELDLDLSDPHLVGTDLRVARAYRELFAGLAAGAEPVLRTFPNTEQYAGTVTVTDIPFHSLCAHHFLPFVGVAHVAYLPGKRLVGLSKLARVVEFYARRPQVQERLTEQIVDLLERRLRPRGVMVVLHAQHFCIEMRGIGKPGLTTTTSANRGAFEDRRARRECLALLPARPGKTVTFEIGRVEHA